MATWEERLKAALAEVYNKDMLWISGGTAKRPIRWQLTDGQVEVPVVARALGFSPNNMSLGHDLNQLKIREGEDGMSSNFPELLQQFRLQHGNHNLGSTAWDPVPITGLPSLIWVLGGIAKTAAPMPLEDGHVDVDLLAMRLGFYAPSMRLGPELGQYKIQAEVDGTSCNFFQLLQQLRQQLNKPSLGFREDPVVICGIFIRMDCKCLDGTQITG